MTQSEPGGFLRRAGPGRTTAGMIFSVIGLAYRINSAAAAVRKR